MKVEIPGWEVIEDTVKDAMFLASTLTALIVGFVYWLALLFSAVMSTPVPLWVAIGTAIPLLIWAYYAYRVYMRIKDVEIVDTLDLSGRG